MQWSLCIANLKIKFISCSIGVACFIIIVFMCIVISGLTGQPIEDGAGLIDVGSFDEFTARQRIPNGNNLLGKLNAKRIAGHAADEGLFVGQ